MSNLWHSYFNQWRRKQIHRGGGGGARLIKIQNLDKQNEGLWLWLRINLHAKKIVLPL